jgi:nitroreductase
LDNSTETERAIRHLIRSRWSPRAFAPRSIELVKLQLLLEAARWAPSSYNYQPWSFILATKDKPAEYARILACLDEFNQIWAKSAPVLAISVAKLYFDNGNLNRHAFHDVGMAVENLTLQALALDLLVHQMAGFDVDRTREVFQIPNGYEPVTAIAIGYRGDPQILPESLRERETAPRMRKPLQDFVFTETWARSADWLVE